jgi:hypothetical protein
MLLVAGCWFKVRQRLGVVRCITSNQQPATSNNGIAS